MQTSFTNKLTVLETQIRQEDLRYQQALKEDLPFAFLKEIKKKIKALKDELDTLRNYQSNNFFS